MKKILLVLILLFGSFFMVSGNKIKPLRKISLTSNEETFIQLPGSFFVTTDDLFYVIDHKAANIKIYENSGKMVKIFGRKGVGPNEFVRPFLSAYREPFIAISDSGRKTFFIFKRTTNLGLEPVKNFLSLEMAYAIKFISDNKLLMAGYKIAKDGKEYNFYDYDFKNNEYTFLIPSDTSYNYSSNVAYRNALKEKLRYIGLFHTFDVSGDNIYFIWNGDLKITRFEREKKTYHSFGQKTANYIQPQVTPQLKKAYKERNHLLIWKLWTDMSFVKNIFILGSKKIGVLYFGPIKEGKGGVLMLQLYTENGDFLQEFEMMTAKASHHNELLTYFKEDKSLLYVLDTEISEASEQTHKIYEFKLEE